MNIFLQFKQKSHSVAYNHDMQLQVTKRLIMVVIWALISVGGTIASFSIAKTIAMSSYDITKQTAIVVSVAGLIFLRCNLQKTKKYLGIINIALDLCLIYVQLILFPYVGGNGLAAFGKLGAFTLGWCACLGCYATYFAIANWWLKAIVPILQIIYFLIPTAEAEAYWPLIAVFAVQCMVIYAVFIYISEVYQKKDFLEKRKVYENYEAIMRIFDDIIQGVMIVDPNYKLIYSNRTIELMFKRQESSSSLENLFSQIHVKSISPRLEMFMTEAIQVSGDQEDSVIN